MAVAQAINVRLPEDLKRHGSQVLESHGLSITEAIRRLFEYLETNQEVPECLQSASHIDTVNQRRDTLKSLIGIVDLPEGFDAKAAYHEHLLEKYGVREESNRSGEAL